MTWHGSVPTYARDASTRRCCAKRFGNPEECLVYVCGPGVSKFDLAAAKEAGSPPPVRFLESVLADLKALGVPDKRIKREFYG